MAQLEELINEWENAVMTYDECTRYTLRQIRRQLALVPDDILEEALDDCGKTEIPVRVFIFCLAYLIEVAEKILLKNLQKLDNDLNQLADSDVDSEDSGVETPEEVDEQEEEEEDGEEEEEEENA